MAQRDSNSADDEPSADQRSELSVGRRVRINPNTGNERQGTIVEDFGDEAGFAVDVGSHHFLDPSRRWAIALDDGNLAFADSPDLEPL